MEIKNHLVIAIRRCHSSFAYRKPARRRNSC